MSSRELREIEDASNFAVGRQEEMVGIMNRVDDMGSFKLWWDSKIPENKKSWYNFMSLSKVSDPEELKKEIAKHKDFYADMRIAIRQVRDGDEDAEELIEDLYEKLCEMHVEAESGVVSTDSKTLYKLHQDFLQKYQQLENKVKRMEVVAVRQQLRRARDDWGQAVNEIRNLKDEMQKSCDVNRDLTHRFEKLMTVNEQLVNQQQELREENTLIKTLLQELIRRQGGSNGGTSS